MPADKESIKVTFFDEKFKNLLRDYYSYGFGRLSNENGVKEATQDIDRERLSNIFRDDMKWENSGDKVSLFCIFLSYNGGFKRSVMCGR